MKTILLCLACLALVACSPSASESSHTTIMQNVAGLEGCKAYTVDNGRLQIITVVRCPNSSTSTTRSTGKSSQTTNVVIDTPAAGFSSVQTLPTDSIEAIKAQALAKLSLEEKRVLNITE